jgi:hypothetical protein
VIHLRGLPTKFRVSKRVSRQVSPMIVLLPDSVTLADFAIDIRAR